jgi:exosortase A
VKTEIYFKRAEPDLKTGQSHALAAAGVVVLAVLLLYTETVVSVVSIWHRADTYAHGFLVPALVAWLIWRRRVELKSIEIRPFVAPIIGVAVAGSIWLAASMAGVLVASQFAVLFMLELAVIAVLGLPITRLLLFPLAFAFFAVPAGEILVPTLIDWTANITIEALRLSGIPVYREGSSFVIPSGRWSVVEACSGIRYLIASLVGGTLFAYLTYRSLTRRLLFVAASLVFPIVANWLRAYLIVMLGHLTDNRLAVGVDHLIYGWVLFGAIITLLFWAGLHWREPSTPSKPMKAWAVNEHPGAPRGAARLWTVAALSIAVAALWPALSSVLKGVVPEEDPRLLPVVAQGNWKETERRLSDWKPHYSGARATIEQTFERGDRGVVGVVVAYYRGQAQGHELVSSGNALVPGKGGRWVQSASGESALAWNGRRIDVNTAELTDGATRLSVRYWFWVNGHITASSLAAQFWVAYAKLTGQYDDAALVLMYAPKSDLRDGSDAMLEEFGAAMSPAIAQALEQARERAR